MVKRAYRDAEDLHWSAITRRGDELGKAAFASLQPRLFGTWEKALRAAGLDPAKISRYRHWDRKSIIAELKRRATKKLPLNSGAIQQEDPGAHAAAVRHFGTYDQALRAAALDPDKLRQRRRWTRDDVIEELRGFAKKRGEVKDSLLRRHAPALYGAALRLFGTLTGARNAAEKKLK
jgi:hypothetical protein